MTKTEKIHEIFNATELNVLRASLESRMTELSKEYAKAEKFSYPSIGKLKKELEITQVLLSQVL